MPFPCISPAALLYYLSLLSGINAQIFLCLVTCILCLAIFSTRQWEVQSMAAGCGTLQDISKKPIPENPITLDSLSSWKQIKNVKPIQASSFTEIYGELHFKDSKVAESVESSSSSSSSGYPDLPAESSSCSPSSSMSSSSSLLADIYLQNKIERALDNKDERSQSPTSSYYPTASHNKQYKNSNSFSSTNSESLSLCTEGLGFESSDDVEDSGNETNFDIQKQKQPPEEKICSCKESKRSRTSKASFPPPISCIGRTGKPWVYFKSYRQDGRFILQEIRFPTQEFLHACREDGRLRLRFVQSDDEILEGEEDEEDGHDCNDEPSHH